MIAIWQGAQFEALKLVHSANCQRYIFHVIIFIWEIAQFFGMEEYKMKKTTIAIATKGYKTKEMKSWEQIAEYQRRGWAITMK